MPRQTYIAHNRLSRDAGADGLHSETLFDENERPDGGLYDERTGERYDNSTFTDPQLIMKMGHMIDLGVGIQGFSEDLMGSIEDNDLTAQWLKEHEVAEPKRNDALSNVA